MGFDVPKEKKVYTTVYDNFKGVDYTNTPTNVFRRRTPTGKNMISSYDGKPQKRTGWDVEIDTADFNQAMGKYPSDNFEIYKCDYFEMAGCDHIILFTNEGLFAYRAIGNNDDVDTEFVMLSDNKGLCLNFDRAFFFDADGETGYYIYGEYQVWKYHYDEEKYSFKFEEAEPTIPTIRISVKPDGSGGEIFQSDNLLTTLVAEEFQSNALPYVSNLATSSDLTGATIDNELFLASYSAAKEYAFKYVNGEWEDHEGVAVTPSYIGITLPDVEPSESSVFSVIVAYRYMTYLAFNVILENADKVKITTMSGDEIEVITGGAPTATQARLETVTEDGASKTRLVYGAIITSAVDGEDALRVVYPAAKAEVTQHSTGIIEAVVTVGGGA